MESEKKFCPLNADTVEVLVCVQGKCAWWDEDAQMCAMLSLSKSVRKVVKNGK